MRTTETLQIKEIILSRIAGILDREYHEPLKALSIQDVTARLAFKADPYLNELRLALERIDRNEYGRCIFCKQEISFSVLRDLPTAHFCEQCAKVLRARTQPVAS